MMKVLTDILNHYSQMDEESRIESILQLKKESVSSGFLKILKLGLSDPSWRVRKTALDIALGKKDNSRIKLLLLEGLHSHDNAGFRNTSTEGLIQIGEKALPLLEKAVNDPDTDVRKIIIDILGEIKSKKSLAIVSRFLKDKDENVRSAAAEAIGKIGDKDGIPILLNTLKGEDNYLKFTVLEALSFLGEKFGIKDIKRIVACLDNSLLGRAAYDALGRSKNPEAMDYLIRGLQDLRRSYRESALIGLVTLYHDISDENKEKLVKELKKNFNEHLKEELLKSLKSFTVRVKLSSAEILSLLKVKESLPHLIELLRDENITEQIEDCIAIFGSDITADIIRFMKESDEFTISSLCRVLKKIGSHEAEDYLIELLRSESDSVRISAADALGVVGTEKSIKELFNLFCEEDVTIKNTARNSLRELSVRYRNEIKQYAVKAIASQDENLRGNAFYILGVTGDKNTIDLINLGLKDEKASVRQYAAEALGMLGYPESLEQLSYALTDEDPRVRLSAVKSVSLIRNPKIIDALKIALRDEHVWVRVSAVKALLQLDSKITEPYLETALMDGAPPVVMSVLENYKNMGDKHFIKALTKVIFHKNIEVIKECLKLLKDINTGMAVKILTDATSHPLPEIRFEIVKFFYENFPKQFKRVQRKILLNEKDEKIKIYISEVLKNV